MKVDIMKVVPTSIPSEPTTAVRSVATLNSKDRYTPSAVQQAESRIDRIGGSVAVHAYTGVTSLPGTRSSVQFPPDERLQQLVPTADLAAVRQKLREWTPVSGSTLDWSGFGLVEQRNAASASQELLSLSNRPVISLLSDLLNGVLTRLGLVRELLDSKPSFLDRVRGAQDPGTRIMMYCRELEHFVSVADAQLVHLEQYAVDLRRFGNKVRSIEEQVNLFLDTGTVLREECKGTDTGQQLEPRLMSLVRSKTNLQSVRLLVESHRQQADKLKSVVLEQLLTGVPGWLAVVSGSKLDDDADRAVIKNNLQALLFSLQGA